MNTLPHSILKIVFGINRYTPFSNGQLLTKYKSECDGKYNGSNVDTIITEPLKNRNLQFESNSTPESPSRTPQENRPQALRLEGCSSLVDIPQGPPPVNPTSNCRVVYPKPPPPPPPPPPRKPLPTDPAE